MYHPFEDNELAILDDDTIRIFSYYDRADEDRTHFTDPLEFKPGEELLLGHVSAGTPFVYTGTVDRDGDPQFHFENQTSDFPVSELVLSPNDFIREVRHAIWHF